MISIVICFDYAAKIRFLLQMIVYFQELRERVRPMVKETVSYMNSAIKDNKKILVECAQSTILDIDFGSLLIV